MADDFSHNQQKLLDDSTSPSSDTDPLEVPNQPDQWKAAKLARILAAYDKSIEHNLKVFNAQGYLAILNEYTSTISTIRKKSRDDASVEDDTSGGGPGPAEVLDAEDVASIFSGSGQASGYGEAVADGVDLGVPTEDPVSGQRVSTV